ncbi:MAG: flagellar basal-body MS-ring/collar protein FliF [Rhodobacteraceae bacterium]|nr:flagellar basal-body MS-ring/collar protein FliF [Paracoccaceae bacterium]
MLQLSRMWAGLDTRRRIGLAVALAGAVGAMLWIASLASRPTMALLFAGLDGPSAGAVVAFLDQAAVPYEIRGESILVPAAERDGLRMALAAEGLPKAGGTGYELLDGMTGFGTTAQMFDAAYWRAKEGELARTIAASPAVAAARVHIANQETRGLRRPVPPSASIAVTTTGAPLSQAQARAFAHLVASAVAGMTPEAVSVVDTVRGVLIPAAGVAPEEAGDARAAELRDSVTRLLEARVGPGNAHVEVAVETVTDSESIRERRIDPDGRVAISTDTQETTSSSTDARGGEVTVASNLPSGDAAPAGAQSKSSNAETRERTNFEVSETTREVVRAPGAIRRLTVAVLVGTIATTAADGTVTEAPRPPEEMAALRELVASAVGFDQARGDVITIQSMPLPAPPAMEGEAAGEAGLLPAGLDLMRVIQVLVLGAVAVVLGLFVVRPVLLRPAPPLSLPGPAAPPVLDGVIDDGEGFAAPAGGFAQALPMAAPMIGSGSGGTAGEGAEARQRLRALVGERRDDAVEVLRSWIRDTPAERA